MDSDVGSCGAAKDGDDGQVRVERVEEEAMYTEELSR
jgi:hypothetical protein